MSSRADPPPRGDLQTPWSGRYLAIHTEGRWEYVARARGLGGAVILALDGDHVILIEQYRVALKANCIELPAGIVGDETPGETIEAAAARELEEETGYLAGSIVSLGRFCSSPGLTSETFALVRATALSKTGEGGGTEAERILVHRVALADVAGFIEARRAEGCVIDARLLTLHGSSLLA